MALATKRLCAYVLAALAACSTPRPSAGGSPPEPGAPPPAAVVARSAPEPAPSPDADRPPDATGWGVAAGLSYLEIVRGEASPNESLPLLIVIHGLGDRPHRGWLYAIDVDPPLKVRMILPQAPASYGQGFAWFPYRFQDRNEEALAGGISEATAQLTQMIEVLRAQRPTKGRAVVTGFSQGGMLSFALALSEPQRVQFALPISGELPTPLWPIARPKRGEVPRVIALHGGSDTVVSFAADEKLAQHLRGLGYPMELVRYEGVGHRISEEMSARARRELSAAIARLPAGKPVH